MIFYGYPFCMKFYGHDLLLAKLGQRVLINHPIVEIFVNWDKYDLTSCHAMSAISSEMGETNFYVLLYCMSFIARLNK